MQKHLDQCPDCRAEIAGLRSVRTDLLAWEVPAHQPVWRPFETAPQVAWWRQVPAWAMAAAAGVMILLGATGSVIAQAMMPGRAVAVDTTSPSPIITAAVTPAEVSAAQARLRAQFEQKIGEVGARVERMSTRTASVREIEGDHDAISVQLRNDYRAQLEIIESLRKDLEKFKTTFGASLQNQELAIKNLTALVTSQIPQIQAK